MYTKLYTKVCKQFWQNIIQALQIKNVPIMGDF
jgi:hypothetical protein